MSSQTTSYSAVLGVVLCRVRKEKEVEQKDMASRMGLSQASYSRLEAGRSSFSMDQMYQAALALGMDENELSSRLHDTVRQLRVNGVEVAPQLRGNTTLAQQRSKQLKQFITGAALAAMLLRLLAKR